MVTTARILIYTDDPGEGGVAVYNTDLACGLAAEGYDVTIAQSEPPDRGVPAGREKIAHAWLPFHTRNAPERNTTDVATATAVLQRTQPDVIVFTNCAPVSQVAATIAAAQLGVPYVIVEGFAAAYPAMTPQQAWMLHYQRLLYAQARAVIAVSAENLSLLRSHFGLDPRKGEVIHYGRPERFFVERDPKIRSIERESLGIPPTATVCVTAARFAPVKGHAHLLAAIEQLRDCPEWQQLYFVWAGDGPLLEDFRNRINRAGLADHVKLVGQRDDIGPLLDAGDVFVLPTHHEGMPLSIMEAMAKGQAVLASAVSGIPEELGETGRLVDDPKVDPARTVSGLVEAIRHWASRPSELAEAGQACRRRAVKMFQGHRMIRDMCGVIERARLPLHDYVSPGMNLVRLDAYFPNLAVATRATLDWKYLRDEIPHAFYIDKRVPGTGFLNRDEAMLLHTIAVGFRGKAGLEVGCWLGWSAAHIAAAGVTLDVVDPILANASFHSSVSESLRAAGLMHLVTLHPSGSPQAIDALGRAGKRWSFMFIDGNHDAPYPVFDTATAIEFAEPDAMVVFHDLASPDVAQALEYLQARGWKTMLYHTAQIMGVAWRGDVTPPLHTPDPRVTWHVPKHLRRFL
jgi:glycosyltransferase involved in cell wall biosynthesis/predicted O-methyltransferase YrrM